MRTLSFGVMCGSSTSGVLPTSSSRLGTVALGIALPQVDRRAELAEELVDPPELAAAPGLDVGGAEPRDELGLAAAQAREPEQRVARIPRAVLDGALAPLGAELLPLDEREARVLRVPLD